MIAEADFNLGQMVGLKLGPGIGKYRYMITIENAKWIYSEIVINC
jgi:hypothetical protein